MSPFCGAHQPRHLGSRLIGFCCLNFTAFKIIELQTLILTNGDKVAAASKSQHSLAWICGVRLHRMGLFRCRNWANKSLMRYERMAAVDILALVVTFFGHWRNLETAASMGCTSTYWANHHFYVPTIFPEIAIMIQYCFILWFLSSLLKTSVHY